MSMSHCGDYLCPDDISRARIVITNCVKCFVLEVMMSALDFQLSWSYLTSKKCFLQLTSQDKLGSQTTLHLSTCPL